MFSFQEATQKRSSCVLANNDLIEKILAYGKELKQLSAELKQEHGTNPANKRALEEAFSLLAYTDLQNSPVAHLLDPTQREPVCSALNSAILGKLVYYVSCEDKKNFLTNSAECQDWTVKLSNFRVVPYSSI